MCSLVQSHHDVKKFFWRDFAISTKVKFDHYFLNLPLNGVIFVIKAKATSFPITASLVAIKLHVAKTGPFVFLDHNLQVWLISARALLL